MHRFIILKHHYKFNGVIHVFSDKRAFFTTFTTDILKSCIKFLYLMVLNAPFYKLNTPR